MLLRKSAVGWFAAIAVTIISQCRFTSFFSESTRVPGFWGKGGGGWREGRWKEKKNQEQDAIQALIASINTVSFRPIFLHESFLCCNYSVHAFEMTLLKWQRESLYAHIHEMMYDSGSCSWADDGWGDTMRCNCLTEAVSINAAIVRLFKNASLFFWREWPCPASISDVYSVLRILIPLINTERGQ